jgi:hypothetical protein
MTPVVIGHQGIAELRAVSVPPAVLLKARVWRWRLLPVTKV